MVVKNKLTLAIRSISAESYPIGLSFGADVKHVYPEVFHDFYENRKLCAGVVLILVIDVEFPNNEFCMHEHHAKFQNTREIHQTHHS